MHWERPFSPRAVKVIVDGVVHENLAIRKVCTYMCVLAYVYLKDVAMRYVVATHKEISLSLQFAMIITTYVYVFFI